MIQRVIASTAMAAASSISPPLSRLTHTHHRSFTGIHNGRSSPPSPSKSLKKVIRPFLAACHPDLMHATAKESTKNKHPLSSRAKEINLKAVQTINGLIDNLEDLIGRCMPPSYSTSSSSSYSSSNVYKGLGSLPELKATYEIEFILPSFEANIIIDDNDYNKPIKKKHRDRESLTLRSITMEFPEHLRSSVRKWALTSFPDVTSKSYTDVDFEPHPQEKEAFRVAMQLREHATMEFVRLLTIAGMEVPRSLLDGIDDMPSGQKTKDESRWTLSDHFLYEMGIHPMESSQHQHQGTSAFFGRIQQPSQQSSAPSYFSKMQQQRQAFMQRIPWGKFRENYDQAFLDAQADWTTSRMNLFNPKTAEGRERRERLVSQICSNVRILRLKQEVDEIMGKNDEEYDDIPGGLDVVQQLIAIRRLNLILYDNFDYLQMENMGRMWENIGIVLLPPRVNRRRSQNQKEDDPRHHTTIHPGRKLTKWERRMKRRDRMKPVSRDQMRYVADLHFNKISNKDSHGEDDKTQNDRELRYLEPESGFKFSYGTRADHGTGQVTAYIPVDFGDDELVRQLYSHVYDYFDNCCGDIGFLSFGADGEVSADATRDIEPENKASSTQ